MSKDNIGNDLSWLASPSFLPSASVSALPKLLDTLPLNRMEPWESLTNIDQVRRNLNKTWVTKSDMTGGKKSALECNSIRSNRQNFAENNMPVSFLRESYTDELLPNVENEMPHNWSCFETQLPNEDKENRTNPSSNLSCFLNFNENMRLNDNRTSNVINCFPLNFEHLNPELLDLKIHGNKPSSLTETYHEEKRTERMNVPITPMDSLSSPTSGAPPKLNTDLIALMQELAFITNEDKSVKLQHQSASLTPFQSPPPTPSSTPTKGCVFCKNNCYHSTFYKSHVLKDDNGHCKCPVLRTYICPLCGGTGDFAHTLKYCPRNTVTKGDPIAAGLPPGKVTNWREVATKMSLQRKHSS